MPLTSGQRIGAYEVLAKLGEGGMGEVYRARDSKLKREVALKVLPADVAADRERLARFQREAEVLASLNHPHIAHVYGIEEAAGQPTALVMELVEGEDLAARLRRGAIPPEEALPIARQIAEALEAAHDAGIVHRDLKPANIKVRDDGTVKVLDFGLAKAGNRDHGPGTRDQGSAADSPTITATRIVDGAQVTEPGVILGTAAYMSPEQARGKRVDKRADVWAFGCVLFEMLSGRRVFRGETLTDTLAAVVNSHPDWPLLPSTTPPRIRRLLARCLEKDPKARLRDIGEARIAIDAVDVVEPEAVSTPATRGGSRASLLPWVIAAAAVIAAVIVAWTARRSTPQTTPLRFVEPVSTASPDGPSAKLAADASFIVYVKDGLQIRKFSDTETHEIPGTKGADAPFISPDSKWIGFFADGKMKKVALDAREPVAITDGTADSAGATFASNDRIVFTPGWYKSALHSVSANGGAVTQVSTLNESAGERGHWFPSALPDGRHVLFTIWYASTGLSTSKIGVLDLSTGAHRVIGPGALAQYADGQVLYFEGGRYRLAPFNPDTQAFSGDPVPVLPDALTPFPYGSNIRAVSMASTGAVAYWPGEYFPQYAFSWIDRDGRMTPTPIKTEAAGAALSPDDRSVAVGRPQGGLSKVWIFDLQGNGQPLPGEGSTWAPAWHPDGRRVAFITFGKGLMNVGTQALDGPRQVVLDNEVDEYVHDWLADGRLVVRRWKPSFSVDLVDPVTKQRSPLVTGDFDVEDARVSPDGRWLAVCADPAQKPALYVRSLAQGGTLQYLAAANLRCNLSWARGSRQLAFVRDNSIVSLDYEERDGKLVAKKESVIATLPPRSGLVGVTRDGSRFMVGIPPAPAVPLTGIRVMLDGIAGQPRVAP